MKKTITFRHMEHSAHIENHANEQLKKIEKILKKEKSPVFIDLVLEPSKVHSHHKIELRIKSPNYDLVSNFEGTEWTASLDRVIDVSYRRLCEEKEKRVVSRRMTGRKDDFKKQR